jgi:hypothetical protein
MNIALEIGDTAGEERACKNLAFAYEKLGQLEKAAEFNRK